MSFSLELCHCSEIIPVDLEKTIKRWASITEVGLAVSKCSLLRIHYSIGSDINFATSGHDVKQKRDINGLALACLQGQVEITRQL